MKETNTEEVLERARQRAGRSIAGEDPHPQDRRPPRRRPAPTSLRDRVQPADARSVRNALERARLRQASRIVKSSKALSRTDLVRIEADDILKSRVFNDGEGAAETDGDDTSYKEAYSDGDSSTDSTDSTESADSTEANGKGKGKANAKPKSKPKD
jgi:hypothetical protein